MQNSILLLSFIIVLCVLSVNTDYAQEWKIVENPLMTDWAEDVVPNNVWPEYPRPQMVRDNWINLNGLWNYNISNINAGKPDNYDGKILVPFPVESALSGVKKIVGEENYLWYQRTFEIPENWKERTILHFGAVDWECTVWLNGKEVGSHKGGYTPFSFDITKYLKAGTQDITVRVWDPTDTWTQPRGKQVSEPGSIWYTSVTGIWQTVWLEPLPSNSITSFEVNPDIDQSRVEIKITASNSDLMIKAVVLDNGKVVNEDVANSNEIIKLDISNPKLWSPDSPFLYDLKLILLDNQNEIDSISSYFGFRKIAVSKDERGFNQLYLNNERLFQLGPLDQGWWPDGLYTPPTDEAMQYDLKVTKELGYNMLRKHVKVESARFYYHCDRMGIIVWQDMPNGNLNEDDANNLKVNFGEPDAERSPKSAEQFEYELEELITHFKHFPSVLMWVIFNEGWGQYDTQRLYKMAQNLDSTRLINVTSGWEDRGIGDVEDIHEYPGPGIEPAKENRAAVLGEFGGLGWPVEDYLWWNKRNWGYRTIMSRKELNDNYKQLVGNLIGCIGYGLSSAVYTQTTDVEGEVNGLMTYDRKIIKFDIVALRRLHNKIYNSVPISLDIIPTSELIPQEWKYTFKNSKQNWSSLDLDDSEWGKGYATFQSTREIEKQAFPTGTIWDAEEIFLRSSIMLDTIPSNLWLQFYVDAGEAELFINGTSVKIWENFRSNRRHYRHENISEYLSLLKAGKNVIAVYAKKERNKSGVDIGLYQVVDP